MLPITALVLAAILVFTYRFFDKDIFSPPTVVTLGFLFAVICCWYNASEWQLDFSGTTTWIIVIGIVSFVAGGIIAVVLVRYFHGKAFAFTHNVSEVRPIDVELSKTVFVILFQLAVVVLLFSELRELTGASSWSEMVTTFREQTANVDPDEYTMKLSGICLYAINFSFSLALLYAYIIGNNIAAKAKQPIINWVPILLSCVLSFMQGYRSDMLRLWIAVLVVTYTLKKRRAGWGSSAETRQMIRRMALSVVVIAVLFVALRGTVGRAETDWDPVYYLAFYAGSPIAALDLFLKDPLKASSIWGKETFYQMNHSIGAYFNKPELRYIFYKEYRTSPGGTLIGNVYTALRPPYYDFGLIGMILVMLLMGLFITYFYCRIRDQRGTSLIDFRLLLYSYVMYTFFLYFYNSYYTFISFGFVRMILELLLFRWFLVGFRIKGSRRYRVRLRA